MRCDLSNRKNKFGWLAGQSEAEEQATVPRIKSTAMLGDVRFQIDASSSGEHSGALRGYMQFLILCWRNLADTRSKTGDSFGVRLHCFLIGNEEFCLGFAGCNRHP
jgi:hypothetical protein